MRIYIHEKKKTICVYILFTNIQDEDYVLTCHTGDAMACTSLLTTRSHKAEKAVQLGM